MSETTVDPTNDSNNDANTATATDDATKRKGRGLDRTPGKEFTPKKLKDLENGKVLYEVPYNDENGVRQVRQEEREVSKRGRKAGVTISVPNKVMTPKAERDELDLVQIVPYNNGSGDRIEQKVRYSVQGDKLIVELID